MRLLTLVSVLTAALLGPGCWGGYRGRGPERPVARYHRDDRPRPVFYVQPAHVVRGDHERGEWEHR
jgi:hypothetical protein